MNKGGENVGLIGRNGLECWSSEFGNSWCKKQCTKARTKFLSTHLNGCRNCIDCIWLQHGTNSDRDEGVQRVCLEESRVKSVLEQFKIKFRLRAKAGRFPKKWHKKRRILKAS